MNSQTILLGRWRRHVYRFKLAVDAHSDSRAAAATVVHGTRALSVVYKTRRRNFDERAVV